jgi:hypothetical protein
MVNEQILRMEAKPLECGSLTPLFQRMLIVLSRGLGGIKPPHSKAPFGRVPGKQKGIEDDEE